MKLYDIFGMLGVVLVLVSYIGLQFEKLKANGLNYSLMNFLGAVFIVYSLSYEFNLPSFIVEVVWMIVSLFGIFKYFYLRRLKKLNKIDKMKK